MFFLKGRKQRVELQEYLQRISDVLNPEDAFVTQENRSENRHSLVYPVFLSPWENQIPQLSHCTYGLSKDLSQHGMAIIVSQRFPSDGVVVGIWPTNEIMTAGSTRPGFIAGIVRSQVEIGATFYKVGVELHELIEPAHACYDKLYTQAKSLLPPDQQRLLQFAVTRAEQIAAADNA